MANSPALVSQYLQVRNPNPEFTPREGKKTLPFCRKLMEKSAGFTSRFDFSMHVAFMRSLGLRRRMPPLLRRRAIDALLQALCFHYDPLANRVQRSITNLAIECGLATESKNGNLSITRATRALRFMAELGLSRIRLNMIRRSVAIFQRISRSPRRCSLLLMSPTLLLQLRGAVALNGKISSVKNRMSRAWKWMS